jgi:hypothetical protein
MSNRLKISLALSVGVCGLILAGANLPVDTQLTIRTKLGKRTQPHWIVPADSKIVKTEGGSGLIRLFGGLVGCLGFGTAMHLAGTDEREQTLFWQKQGVVSKVNLKEHEACAEIYAGARLKKLQMEAQADVDYHSLQLQQKFRDAIGWSPVVQQPILPHGRPGTLDEITNPGDKVEAQPSLEVSVIAGNKNVDSNVDTFGVSEIASDKPEIAPGLLHPSETKSLPILRRLASSRKSLLNIAGTGGGKTVTQSCLISLLLEMCPKTEFWGVSQKNDSYCGLREKGRITIFDITNIQATLDVIHHVWKIYNTRRMLPEEKRANLSPVRLLLGDWFSISLALNELSSHPAVKASKYLVEMVDIVLNGRDFNICLWADLQSFNLEAIGMKADKNSRQNFNLLGLGNYYTNDEGVNESYGVLNNMINDHFMVPNKETRIQLLSEFERLKPISMQHERPILFVTLEPPTICLQADIRHYQQRHRTPSNEVSDVQIDISDNSSRKDTTLPEQDDGNFPNAYRKGVEGLEGLEVRDSSEALNQSLNGFLAEVINESLPPVFADDFPLKKHDRRVELAKLVIARNLGKQKTIWLLWGVRDGGRNNQRYIDAREMLDRLIKGEKND